MNLSIDPTAERVACACADGVVRVFTLINNKMSAEVSTLGPTDEKLPLMSVKWLLTEQTNLLVAASAGGRVSLVSGKQEKGAPLHQFQEVDNYIMSVDSHPRGVQFATAGKDCLIRLYDSEKTTINSTLQGIDWAKSGHNNRLCCVKYVD
jgi:COMPASS component SWD3